MVYYHCALHPYDEPLFKEAVEKTTAANVSKVIFVGSWCCAGKYDIEKIAAKLQERGIESFWIDAWGPVVPKNFADVGRLVEAAGKHRAGMDYLRMMKELREEGLVHEIQKALESYFGESKGFGIHLKLFGPNEFIKTYPEKSNK